VTRAGQPSRAYAAYALGLLTLINVLNYTDRNVVFALFEPIKVDLRLSDAQLGWIGSAYIIVLSVMALPLGVIGDLRSRRGVITIGVTLWSLATAAGGLVTRYWQLFACRALVGVGEAGYMPASQAIVAEYYPGPSRAMAMGIYSVGMAFGGVLGIWVGGEQRWFAQCGFEALATCWLFPGQPVRVEAACLDCGDPMVLVIRDGRLETVEPSTVVGHCNSPWSLLADAKNIPFM